MTNPKPQPIQPQSGVKAPDFTAPVTPDGQELQLSSLRGSLVVLYFYPRDNTPGCTIENIDFSGLLARFRRLGVHVYGISRDKLRSHQNFCSRHSLKVPLFADPDEIVCNLYGVMRDKNMYGKQVRGIERSTFLIDSKGKIVHVWCKVNVAGHAEEVLAHCRELKAK
ncbi:MAG: peroxiredoxin [Proteobacteria bacterium]|nr:peroxiredoxin [Pseudomonadota bacterium]